MKPQYKNKLTSAFILWFDHEILSKGEAYYNTNGYFYNVKNNVSPYYTYGSSYNQFVADDSVLGETVDPTIITGVYLTGTFTAVGSGGLVDIDYSNGRIFMDHQIANPNTSISGSFSIKDFNIEMSSRLDEELLFETAFVPKAKININQTGLADDQIAYPCAVIKNNGGENQPFALGGMDETVDNVRVIVFSDSLYKLDAISSIASDSVRKSIPLLNYTENPFNNLGGFKSGNYNYTGLVDGKGGENIVFIERVVISTFNDRAFTEVRDLQKDVFPAVIDFEISSYRYPRQ